MRKQNVLFLGMGNPILADDAVGIRVVEKMESLVDEGGNVEFASGSIAGLHLLDLITGFERLVVVDAIKIGGRPGTLHKISIEDLNHTRHFTSVHSINFVTAVEIGRKLGMDVPRKITIYGIEVSNAEEFSEKMTPEVEDSVNRNAREIVATEIS